MCTKRYTTEFTGANSRGDTAKVGHAITYCKAAIVENRIRFTKGSKFDYCFNARKNLSRESAWSVTRHCIRKINIGVQYDSAEFVSCAEVAVQLTRKGESVNSSAIDACEDLISQN